MCIRDSFCAVAYSAYIFAVCPCDAPSLLPQCCHVEMCIRDSLKQGEAGLTTAELCRQHGITEQTYYRWKAKYGGMDSGEAKRLKQLEDENRKLKHVVAELTLDNRALKDVLSKNW